MPKSILIILIVSGSVGYLISSYYIKYISNLKPKILETRDFSCPGMTGFTFKYPVFEGWEIKEIRPNNIHLNEPDKCNIYLNWPGYIKFEVPPAIYVHKQTRDSNVDFEILAEAASNKNPNGIPHIYTEDAARGNFTTFYIPGFKVHIELGSYSEQHGFSKEIFWKTVIESFKEID